MRLSENKNRTIEVEDVDVLMQISIYFCILQSNSPAAYCTSLPNPKAFEKTCTSDEMGIEKFEPTVRDNHR